MLAKQLDAAFAVQGPLEYLDRKGLATTRLCAIIGFDVGPILCLFETANKASPFA
jgi:hypothetical protein